jgi:spermidine synthase
MNWVVYTLFFVSGACGLIYEVVWSRMMTLIFGRSVLAVGTVLAAFMLGLALGSYVLGKYADRHRNPLRLYAVYEIGAGVSALIASLLLIRITPLYVWVHATFGEIPVAFALVRFLIAFALLIVPTVLMGATLPILSRVIVKRLSHIGQELGLLYAINTIGAVAGSLAAGFYLISRFGMQGAVYTAVAGNLAVGAAAWFASNRAGAAGTAGPMTPAAQAAPPVPAIRRMHRLVLWAFALSGLTSFAYEIFWTRSLVFLIGNTTYAFTLMLTAFLLGIALGGYAIRFLADIIRNPLMLFAVIEVLIGVSSAAALPLLFFVVRSPVIHAFVVRFSGQLELLALSNFVASLSLMLLPATLIGATLPLMGKIIFSDLQNTGTTVGRIYAINTLGNVLGALLPGLLIMPLMGIQKGIFLMAVLNIALGIVLALARWKHAAAAAAVTAACFMLFASALVRTPISFKFPSESEKARDEVLYYREGGLVTTKVWISAATGHKVISVDGINIGGTGGSDYKQQILAHLPKLLLKSYSSELTIGLGSGILMGESARHAALKKIVCVEISKGVVEGSRYFERENFHILSDPRSRIVVDDVVDFLETSTDRFDIISADEKTAGKYATNSFSYSKEYYALLRRHIAPGGLVIQWMPTDLPHSQYALAIRTFLDEFPHAQLWYFPPVAGFTITNTLLVGSNDPLEIDPANMRRALETDPASFHGISKYGLTSAEAVLAHWVGDKDTLQRVLPAGPVNTFDRPYYEFYSPADYAVPPNHRTLQNHEMLMLARGEGAQALMRKGAAVTGSSRLRTAIQAEGIFLEGHGVQLRGQPVEKVLPYYDRALGLASWNANLHNEIHTYLISIFLKNYYAGNLTEATDFIHRASIIYPESPVAHFDYGRMLWIMKQPDEAVKEILRSIALDPGLAPARRYLASIYASLGKINESMDQWKTALALDAGSVPTLVGYGIFLAETRPGTEAINYARRAYQLDPEDPEVIDGYARVLYLCGDLAEARRTVLRGGDYYKNNAGFEQMRKIILDNG